MSGSILVVIVGLVLIVLGLISIFAKDLAWEMTEWQNRNRGVQSERTPEWERSTTLGGVITIGAGVFFLFAAATIF
jgi:hypothetical protein